jgi:hypothetical protein
MSIDFNLILYGKDQFYSKLNNKQYNILVINNKKKIIYFTKKLIEFQNKKNVIIGIDFEFKKVSKELREIALIQINIEDDTNIAYIFIFDPTNLSKNELNEFINILIKPDIIKILHGGESLDIPYIFDTILNQNDKLIKQFIINLYDTKFLCEYYHIENKIKNKCSIYELLSEFKIIGEKQIKYLEKLENNIGEIYLIDFNIDTLTPNLIEYALYDVIYLPTLLNKFINISKIYKNIILELTGITYYHKRNINLIFNTFQTKINKYNNNFIIINYEKINLIDIFYYYYYCEFSTHLLVNLSEVTFFKEFIETILKYLIYSFILKKYKVYTQKNIENKEKIEESTKINKIILFNYKFIQQLLSTIKLNL